MSGSETDIQWFIARDGKQHGPVSDLELKKIVELTHLKPTDLVWRQGFTDWRTASSVFPELAGPAPAASPAPASPSPSASAAASAPATAKPASAAPSTAAQSAAPAAGTASLQRDTWRPQQGETTGRPEPTTAARTLGGPAHTLGGPAQRTAGPFSASPGPAPGPAPRTTTESRRPSELSSQPRPPADPPSRGRRLALVAAGLIAMTGVGAWISSRYTDEMFSYMQVDDTPALETGAATPTAERPRTATAIPAAVTTTTTAPVAPASLTTAEDVDRNLQGRGIWVAIKQEFPEWYQVRVTDIARLNTERKGEQEVSAYLVNALVSLRRENAKYALAASTTRHRELAAAFLANLNRLSQEGGDQCYEFISKGESSNIIIERIGDPAKSTEIDAQILATVTAIAEGKKQPADHAAPVKTDYDVLAGELGRLGWTQADMQLFANPKALAQAPRARVCNMLKDWFTAHLAIQDPNTQERLLFETLKPVISG